ncbi:MAG: hypothetical protein IT242_00920 [Bacteroidia bacterium]|nr:hypothetical protein [Bacteroidia bacterium]
MKLLVVSVFVFLATPALKAQKLQGEEMFRNYFSSHLDSLDPIEGIWNVASVQEYYRYDTLYDIVKYPKGATVAVMKKDGRYESYNLNGEPYDVQFSGTDVKGVYLYRNFFRETNEYSKAQAVISKSGVMEYTYEFPDDFLRTRFGDSYEEGTRVVNQLKWSRLFPENTR